MTLDELKSTIERYCENKDFETAKNYVCTHGSRLGLNLEEELRKIENFGKNPVQQLPVPSVENEEKKESE
jgi:hypothetical protein